MQSALRDMTLAIAALVILAYSTGQREWLWKQIAVVRQIALTEARQDWGCPSIFDKSACQRIITPR
mgnify:CR=1 FL=1